MTSSGRYFTFIPANPAPAIVNQSTVVTAFMAPAVCHVQCPLGSGRDAKEEAMYGSAEGESSSQREGSGGGLIPTAQKGLKHSHF